MNCVRLPLCLLVCLVMSGIEARETYAQDQVPGLKADSLALFGYYFTWPPNALQGDLFVIGVLGEAPFSAQRITERVKSVKQKRIQVLQFDSAKDYKPCHILFVANDAAEGSVEKKPEERLAAVVKKIANAPVLIVAEQQGFAKRGAMVNFIIDQAQNRLKTEVNNAAVRKARIGFTKYFVDFSQTDKCILVN